MKKVSLSFLLLLALGLVFQSCKKSKTYAEMLKEEREAIQNFIEDQKIKVITAAQFYAQDSTTNVAENEYVLFKDNGVYMQIVNKGGGEKIPEGVRVDILSRFVEVKISTRDTLLMNPVYGYEDPEEWSCTKRGTSLSGTFTQGYMTTYGNSVPTGWLIPLSYVNLGRNTANLAKVKLIVPSKQGQHDAAYYVYPCFYELSYQLVR